MGAEAVDAVLSAGPDDEPVLIGIRNNKIIRQPLMYCVAKTREINEAIQMLDFDRAMELRGPGYQEAFRILRTMVRAMPHAPLEGKRRLRIGIVNAGGAAPGMNAAVRTIVRLSVDKGHIPLGIKRGFRGLIENNIEEMGWYSVNGWAPQGGSVLGTSRKVPDHTELYAVARTLEEHRVDALVVIGGYSGYEAASILQRERRNFPSFNIPIFCIPATIDNNLPAAEFSIGADTALNSITSAVDKIKQSAVAANRVFVVEVMGQYCGYLALMSAISTGAEKVYMHEEGIRLADLQEDIDQLRKSFMAGKRLGLMIRGEYANQQYTTDFIAAIFEEEGGDLFDVRVSVLGHLQQGGDPCPFDRILASRMLAEVVEYIEEHCGVKEPNPPALGIGQVAGEMRMTPLEDVMRMADEELLRPREQWWLGLRPIAAMMARQTPTTVDVALPAPVVVAVDGDRENQKVRRMS
jgi:6-phosphofructokinase 1